jgi:hypothetical protein
MKYCCEWEPGVLVVNTKIIASRLEMNILGKLDTGADLTSIPSWIAKYWQLVPHDELPVAHHGELFEKKQVFRLKIGLLGIRAFDRVDVVTHEHRKSRPEDDDPTFELEEKLYSQKDYSFAQWRDLIKQKPTYFRLHQGHYVVIGRDILNRLELHAKGPAQLFHLN